MLRKLTGIVVFRHRSAAEAAHTQSGGDRPTESRAHVGESGVDRRTKQAGLAAPPESPVRMGSTAGSLSCQVETPLRVFLHSCGTSYLRSQALLQCTACGRVPEQHPRPVGCSWPMRAHPTTGPEPPVAGSDVGRIQCRMLVGCRWAGHRVGCGGADDRAGGDSDRSWRAPVTGNRSRAE